MMFIRDRDTPGARRPEIDRARAHLIAVERRRGNEILEIELADAALDARTKLVLATKRATEREPGRPIGEETLQRGVGALPDRRPPDRDGGFDDQCGRGVPWGVSTRKRAGREKV